MNNKPIFFLLVLLSFISCQEEPEPSIVETGFEFNFPTDCCELTQFSVNGVSDLQAEGINYYRSCVFTPDGFHDNADSYWVQTNDQVESITSFEVSDEDGVIVYSQENIVPNDSSMGWDGMINQTLNDGPYKIDVSFITVDGTVVEISHIICILLCEIAINDLTYYIPQGLNIHNVRWPHQHDGEGGFEDTLPGAQCIN